MKITDLRATLLTIGCILLATFLLGGWNVSRQMQTLRKIEDESSAKRTELALLSTQLETERERFQVLLARKEAFNQNTIADPVGNAVGALLRAKLGFNDIQHHVARGEYPGLALTDGYMELKRLFDNPAFEEMIGSPVGDAVGP